MYDGMEEITDGETLWRFDRDFLESRWACLWVEAAWVSAPSRLSISASAAVRLAPSCVMWTKLG